ncbi:MAG: transglutaminase domain-containing protein [Candidatus Methanomethylophilaceae archaeon]|nr:transglutaminase domain-containing protein [Candidatus Methanomethylophilaceae archaeon]MBP5735737.1 transglutaminase domain-containing protein [Candidatus Methanomethylophilaceae archaeon]
MVAKKKAEKGFCPFCGRSFGGDHDVCPFCGQNLKMYKDDLGPIMNSIQTATNIDMKSPKVRITMSVVVFLLAFAGALVVFDYYDNNFNPANQEVIVPEGIVIDLQNNGYLDLVDDFANQNIKVLPLYDPELKLQFDINPRYQGDYDRIVWNVMTESYNDTNMKNPFYQKVTKDRSNSDDIYSVVWDNLCLGRFWITAECYSDDGCDVFVGSGTYYGKMPKTYSWTYNGKPMTFDYIMSADEVKACLTADLNIRLDQQSRMPMTSYVSENDSIKELNNKLLSLYNKGVDKQYTDADYADFVLSFIQSCFPEVFDSYNYRVSDYWAYPTETLFRGCGDDEDRAILYCAIMKAAGMNVGILSFPEATIAAVEVNLDESFIGTYAKTVRGLEGNYTIADTTSELRLGELRPYYGVSEDGRTLYYNGEELHGRYGLETV